MFGEYFRVFPSIWHWFEPRASPSAQKMTISNFERAQTHNFLSGNEQASSGSKFESTLHSNTKTYQSKWIAIKNILCKKERLSFKKLEIFFCEIEAQPCISKLLSLQFLTLQSRLFKKDRHVHYYILTSRILHKLQKIWFIYMVLPKG